MKKKVERQIRFFSILAGILATTSTLTIGQNPDLMSDNLTAQAQAEGHWKADDGEFDFAKAFSAEYEGISLSDKQKPDNRLNFMQNMLRSMSDGGIRSCNIWQDTSWYKRLDTKQNLETNLVTVCEYFKMILASCSCQMDDFASTLGCTLKSGISTQTKPKI